MKLLYKEVEINMEHMQTKVRRVMPAWEVPVQQSVHPDTNEIRDIVVDQPAPGVQAEYERLSNKFGAGKQEDGSIGAPNVEGVYGKGPLGLAELRRAMEASRLPAATPVTPIIPPPTMNKDLLAALREVPAESDVIGEIAEDDETIAA
jgi:hypothetical protein